MKPLKKTLKKRMLSWLLSLSLCSGMLAAPVYAEGPADTVLEVSAESQEEQEISESSVSAVSEWTEEEVQNPETVEEAAEQEQREEEKEEEKKEKPEEKPEEKQEAVEKAEEKSEELLKEEKSEKTELFVDQANQKTLSLRPDVTGYGVPLPEGAAAPMAGATTPVPTQAQAYSAMMALKPEYPEGMHWTNDNYYGWKGGIFSGGYGCAGFAFILSDAAFGDLPARLFEDVSISKVHVGDILRVNNDLHSVIITEVYSDHVVLAEGNYNSSIHWGRTMTAAQVAAADYCMTRYPVGTFGTAYTITFDGQGGEGVPSSIIVDTGSVRIPDSSPMRIPYSFAGWARTAGAKTAQYQPGDSIAVNADMTLYAVWQKAEYPVLANQYPLHIDREVTIPGSKVIYTVKPDVSRVLHITSVGNEDTLAAVYNSAGERILFDDDSGDGYNFALDLSAFAGETYYLVMWLYENWRVADLSFDVTATELTAWDPSYLPIEELLFGENVIWFRPERDGIYHLESTGLADPIVYVETKDGELIAQDDDSGDAYNFATTFRLEAGKIYRFHFYIYSDAETPYTVLFSEIRPLTLTKDLPDYTEVQAGQDVVLSVEAEGNGLTYLWQSSVDGVHWVGMSEMGNDQPTIRFKASMDMYGYSYRCYIQDKDENSLLTNETMLRVKKANPFTDLSQGAYYYDAVLWAVEQGITSGKTATTFAPNEVCTRAQVVTFLWRYYGSPEPSSKTNPFVDVKSGTPFYKAILWALESGITSGVDGTHFKPDDSVTRAQFVTFLWRANGKMEPKMTKNPFTDVKSGTPFYKAILWAYENNITQGVTATTFVPDQACTRGQVVTFIYRGPRG